MKTLAVVFCALVLALALSNDWKAYADETGYSLDGYYSGSSVKENNKVE